MASYIKYFILFFIFNLGTCIKLPSITYITKEQIKSIGDKVVLSCAVENDNGGSVAWNKYNSDKTKTTPLTLNATTITPDPRLSVYYVPTPSLYEIQIENLQVDDAGVYQCASFILENTKITADVELLIRRPPIIFDNSTKSIVGGDGESVKFECYADGYPEPKISWHREDKAILPTGASIYYGNIMNIDELKNEYYGTYYCVAENEEGKARRKIDLQILSAPVVTVRKGKVEQALGENAILSCHVEGYPPPALTWHRNGEQLPFDNPHYRISNFATDENIIETMLQLVKTDKQDYGLYMCKAKNKYGEHQGTVEFYGKSLGYTSIIRMSKNQEKNVGDVVDLECVVNNPQNYSVSWLKTDKDDHKKYDVLTKDADRATLNTRRFFNLNRDESRYTLTITDLQESDSGLYQCQVSLSEHSRITADVVLTVNSTT